jgi:hypothetical protein
MINKAFLLCYRKHLLEKIMLTNILKVISAAIATALLATGCAVHTPGGSVVLDPDRTYSKHPHDGTFCPPGQAKTGRC